jgi:ribose 5-phosphate isomerase A
VQPPPARSSSCVPGCGSVSAARQAFRRAVGGRVHAGLDVIGVPTSRRPAYAERHGVPLNTLDEMPQLDPTVDGADESPLI